MQQLKQSLFSIHSQLTAGSSIKFWNAGLQLLLQPTWSVESCQLWWIEISWRTTHWAAWTPRMCTPIRCNIFLHPFILPLCYPFEPTSFARQSFILPSQSVCWSIFSSNSGSHLIYAILWLARPLIEKILDSPTQCLADATFGTSVAFQVRKEYITHVSIHSAALKKIYIYIYI